MNISDIMPYSPDDFYGTNLFILGEDIPSIVLSKRIQDGLMNDPHENINDYQISYGSILSPIPMDTLFVIDDKISKYEAKRRYPGVNVIHMTSREALQGYGYPEIDNPSLNRINETDWQALRNIERQLLAMHNAGVWILPDDVRLAMIEREALRADL